MIMYKLINNLDKTQSVQRLSDSAYIPFNPDNTDYQAYLAWIEQGGIPISADETL